MSEQELRSYFNNQWKPAPIRIPESKDSFLGVDVNPIYEPLGTFVGALGIAEAKMTVYKEGLFQIFAAGFRVVAFEHNAPRRNLPRVPGIHRKHIEMAYNIRDGMNHFGIDKANGLAHSQGGVALLTAGYLFPERWDNFVVADLAAATEPIPTTSKRGTQAERIERFWRLAKMFFKGAEQVPPIETIEDPIIRNFLVEAGKSIQESVLKHPVSTLEEGIATSNADIRWLMRYLRTIHNKRIGLVINTEDLIYPVENLIAALKTDPYFADIVAPIKGGHNQMILEMPKHIALGVEVLKALEKLQKDPSTRLDKVQIWDS